MFLRALLAFIALPGVVAFLIPLSIASGSQPAPGIAAFIALGAGLATLLWCVGSFYVSGKGTLAPWRVFCSYGSVKCPPVQEAGACCSRAETP